MLTVLRRARRVALFAGVPLLGAVSPLVVLPMLTRELGAEGWAAFAVGQATGTFGALVVNWGWGVEGAALTARTAQEARSDLYASSVRSRMLTAALAAPVVFLIAVAVAPQFKLSTGVLAIAVCLSGALPNWFFIGSGTPALLGLFDGVPRLLAAVAAALLLPAVPSDWVYPLLLLAATAIAVVASVRLLTGTVLHRPRLDDVRGLRSRGLLLTSMLVSSGYTTLSTPIVATIAAPAVAVFAAASRFQGFGALGLGAITNAGQGWVSAHGVDESELRRRRLVALLANAAVGLLGGICCVLALPFAAELLFSGTVPVPPTVAALVGGILFLLAISMSTTFHVLIPAGRTRVVAVSGMVTSAVGVPLLVLLTLRWGSTGAVTAILLAEAVSAAIQLGACARGRARPVTSSSPA